MRGVNLLKSAIKEYQNQFKILSNRVTRLSPYALLSCFSPGLKPQIRREEQA